MKKSTIFKTKIIIVLMLAILAIALNALNIYIQ